MYVNLLRRFATAFARMSPLTAVATAAAVIALAVATAVLVYETGGVRFAYLHLMYVPIVLGAIAFGLPGGVAAGIGGGVLLGPWMPIDTSTGEMQEPLNWIYRLVFFALIGLLVGTWSALLRRHLRELEWLHEHHDDTGLLNLAGLMRRLDEITGATGDRTLSVSVTQLNGFLEIQNTFGAAFGTRVLGQVLARAQALVPPGSLIALIQPDRLATVVHGDTAAEVTRKRLESAVKQSYLVDGVPIHVEASIGVARFPAHGRTTAELLQKASIAMHWAVSSNSSISQYDAANDHTSRDNLLLLGELPGAIERGELRIWHQAKLALATGEIGGTEALLRWDHPERGTVSPGRFMPQTEETTLIDSVTRVAIAAALADAGAWRAAGHRLRVSVNLSVRNLGDRALLEVLERHTFHNGLEPSDIELEITESAVMADPDACIRLIGLLRDQGYGVAIDDFGVGQSSLAYLQKLRASALKIDQEFVKTLATDANNQKIVQAILHLAKALGLQTVAEGVEDVRTVELLTEWGCDYAQGYAVHRPSPANDVLLVVEERRVAARRREHASLVTAPKVS
jgi:predicted signal transduction protein with EAL and GGDEF domain